MKSKLFIISLILIICSHAIYACKTPVYKYALKNWQERDFYQVIKIFDLKLKKGENKKDKKSESKSKEIQMHPIEKYFKEKGELANADFIAIEKNEDIKNTYGEFMEEIIKKGLKKNKTPFYIITNPDGLAIHTGELSVKDMPSLFMSPARVKIAKELSQEKIVLLFVASKNEEKNKKAEKALKEGIKEVIVDELEYRKNANDPEVTEEEIKNYKPIKISYVKIDPKDPKEIWLYRQMKKASSYITDDDQPKVFGVVGRGFVFEQYLSEDSLNKEGVADLVLFLSGPCSCTVKSGNPGIDILTNWDWDESIESSMDDDEPEQVDGFGGEEIEDTIEGGAEDKIAETSKLDKLQNTNISKPDSIEDGNIASPNEFLKLVLFAIIGLGISLLLITQIMKVDKE
ncbi:MAG: hypothetical protein COA79_24760 [Planctomycetota bacterium]|nr:MAG: hypothetical protein COA79_24760 [Planctomycetota bacterium]